MTIQHSEIESSVTGLRIGRSNAQEVCTETLLPEIFNGQYDLCRLKISAEDEMASIKLARMGLPFFFSGSIRRYDTPIDIRPVDGYLNPTLQFVVYDGSQHQLLYSLLTDTWGSYPIGYYRSPILDHLVDKEMELECVFRYYDKHNAKDGWPDSSIMLMIDQGDAVGFFALNKINGNLESHIGGILKRHQKRGYFYDMLTFIKNYCVDHGLPRFLFGARNENTKVQRIFEQAGFSSVGNDNVYHIAPMLTYSQTEPSRSKLRLFEEKNSREVHNVLHEKLCEFHNSLYCGEFQQTVGQIVMLETPLNLKDANLTITVPVRTDDLLLLVACLTDTNDMLHATAHYMFTQRGGSNPQTSL